MSRYKELNRFMRRWNFIKELIRRRDISFAVYRLKWRMATDFKILPSFPVHLDIELNSNCNYRCVFCPHGTGDFGNDLPMMSFEMYKRVIDEAAVNGTYSIKLNWRGEPAIYPQLAEAVAYAKKAGIKEVQINTNASLFNEAKIRNLVRAGIDRVIFSIDATTPDLYSKIRVGGSFDKVVKNIKTFNRVRKELKQTKPFLRVQMVRTEINKHQIDDFKKMWAGIVDDIRISDVTDRGQGDNLRVGDQVSIGRVCCPQPWQRMMVSCTGEVMMCCSDWFGKYVIGHISRNSLKEIWLGEKMNIARRKLKSVNYNFEPCKDCWIKESYKWESIKKRGANHERH